LKIRPDWQSGSPDAGATAEFLATLRGASDLDAAKAAVEIINRGVAPQSVWDALFDGAGEVLMRRPGIVGLHAVTTANALYYLYTASGDEATRRWITLQCASFVPSFRESSIGRGGSANDVLIDKLEPLALAEPDRAVAEICGDISRDRLTAARKVLTYVRENPNPKALIDATRLLIFAKGNDAHDYKFSSAVLEDFYHVTPAWRDKYLAASVFNLTGSQERDNALIERARSALSS